MGCYTARQVRLQDFSNFVPSEGLGLEVFHRPAEFLAGTVGPDFDKGAAPTCEFGDLVSGFFLEMKKGENETVVRCECLKQLKHERVGVFVGAGGQGFVCIPGVLSETLLGGAQVFPMEFGMSRLVTPVVATDIESDPGNPVFNGLGGIVAMQILEQPGKGFLGQIFGTIASCGMASNDS